MTIKITSHTEAQKCEVRPTPKVKKGDTFLLPRYKATIVNIQPHKTIADIMVVEYKMNNGPNKGKTFNTQVPANSNFDCTDTKTTRFFRSLFQNSDKVAAVAILIIILSVFLSQPGGFVF